MEIGEGTRRGKGKLERELGEGKGKWRGKSERERDREIGEGEGEIGTVPSHPHRNWPPVASAAFESSSIVRKIPALPEIVQNNTKDK